MFTYCPECNTVFAIRVEQLYAARGDVRCGQCRHVYNAVDLLFDEVGDAREAARKQLDTTDSVDTAPSTGSGAQDEAAGVGEGATPPADTQPAFVARLLPQAAGWQQGGRGWRDLAGAAGVAALLAVLAMQWLVFNRDSLARDAGWRPTVERVCGVLGCELPLMPDPARIELVEHAVRKHPDAEDALLLDVTLHNHSDHDQPWPVLSVRFSDLAGKPVAMRHFRPVEYLADTDRAAAGFAADSRAQARLEIGDPGDAAVSFQFEIP